MKGPLLEVQNLLHIQKEKRVPITRIATSFKYIPEVEEFHGVWYRKLAKTTTICYKLLIIAIGTD